ncbi:transporter substrate-binding domain-containing protein [Utexia brackfieldae]|uniref:transporter substrate-binding domain-containing protein n=1 Tax=Utexia brackfieldae TaxID=3074108 RepID=UPI00370D59F4
MKKRLCLILLLATIAQVQAKPYEDIIASKVIRIGVPGDYAPLAFVDRQGQLVGFDIDMAKSFAKSQGLTPQFVITSWPTLSADLTNDKYDIAMGGITYTPERAKQFLLSGEVVTNGKVALAACQSVGKVSSLAAINQPQVKVVVNPGGTNETFVNQHIQQAEVIRVKNNIDNLQALRDKRADMMVTDLIEANYYQHNEPGILCLGTPKPFAGTESFKVYMTQKENIRLMDEINHWIPTSDKSALANKWGISLELPK